MEFIYIKNFKQACAYIDNNVKPVDMKYENGRLTFIFKAEDTKEVWEKWKTYDISLSH